MSFSSLRDFTDWLSRRETGNDPELQNLLFQKLPSQLREPYKELISKIESLKDPKMSANTIHKIEDHYSLYENSSYYYKFLLNLFHSIKQTDIKMMEIGCGYAGQIFAEYLMPKTWDKKLIDYNEGGDHTCWDLDPEDMQSLLKKITDKKDLNYEFELAPFHFYRRKGFSGILEEKQELESFSENYERFIPKQDIIFMNFAAPYFLGDDDFCLRSDFTSPYLRIERKENKEFYYFNFLNQIGELLNDDGFFISVADKCKLFDYLNHWGVISDDIYDKESNIINPNNFKNKYIDIPTDNRMYKFEIKYITKSPKNYNFQFAPPIIILKKIQ